MTNGMLTIDQPRVSVVIPVRDRRDLLAAALDALDAQTYHDFEVIVVDDGSTDGSRELAAGAVVAGRPVRVLDNPGRGAIEARQHAAEQSATPLLAFTDSDCVPSPQWLERLVDACDRGADLVTGPTHPARPPKPLERSMFSSGDDGGYPTCNVLYRRTWFERVGGFETRTKEDQPFSSSAFARNFGFWEDTRMGWRLRRAGAIPAFAPDAVVHHHVFAPDIPDLLRRKWMLGDQPSLIREVPELRDTLLANKVIFQLRSRVLVYVMFVGVILRRPRLVAVAVAMWAFARGRRHVREGVAAKDVLVALPVELAADVVLTAGLVRGSVTARTLVL